MKCSTCRDELGANSACVECIILNPQIKEGERLVTDDKRREVVK